MRAPAGGWRRCMQLAQRSPCPDLRRLRATHAAFVAHGLHRYTYAFSRLVLLATTSAAADHVAAANFLSYASLLFRHAETPLNSFIYNALIQACARGPRPQAALFYFRRMLHHQQDHWSPSDGHGEEAAEAPAAVVPDHLTFPFVLHACASLPSHLPGQQVHAFVYKNGLASADHYVQTALLRFYVGFMEEFADGAQKLFDEIPMRDAVHWDVLMNGYMRRDLPSQALCLFHQLIDSGVELDEFVLTTALSACAHAGALDQGVWIHDYMRNCRVAFLNDPHICTTLVSMYAKCGCIDKAAEVFDGVAQRSSFLWAAMIGGFAMHGFAREAIACLQRMQVEDGLQPDGIALLGVLSACSHAGLVEEGRLLLDQMPTQYGFSPKHEHYSCTVDLLCRVGRLEEAVELIRSMPMRPLASVWGSLLSGCRTYNNVELAELAVEELLRMEAVVGGGVSDGAHVQLWSIYMKANRQEDAGRIRKSMVSSGVKKTPGCSVIEVDGVVNSFVSADQSHPLRLRIYEILDRFSDHVLQGPIDEII
ncbi:hypothetical protein Taro_025146 [Colocasia esculenta]|uniref:Pentatricopeptide repeat-containing protein n=1 Tax=Colocasia esculenta TaxID=4460 RepID=A0A843V9F7_COLES|nr:hypothetical protein [Colocasia esculenta]